MEKADVAIDELTLILLYLTSWKETEALRASWRSYDFDALDRLEEKELVIRRGRGSKSVLLPEESTATVKRLMRKYGIEVRRSDSRMRIDSY